MTDYVYPGFVRSQTDGDLHYVSAPALVRLYGLDPKEVVQIRDPLDMRGRIFSDEDRHFYPRRDGNYKRVDR